MHWKLNMQQWSRFWTSRPAVQTSGFQPRWKETHELGVWRRHFSLNKRRLPAAALVVQLLSKFFCQSLEKPNLQGGKKMLRGDTGDFFTHATLGWWFVFLAFKRGRGFFCWGWSASIRLPAPEIFLDSRKDVQNLESFQCMQQLQASYAFFKNHHLGSGLDAIVCKLFASFRIVRWFRMVAVSKYSFFLGDTFCRWVHATPKGIEHEMIQLETKKWRKYHP